MAVSGSVSLELLYHTQADGDPVLDQSRWPTSCRVSSAEVKYITLVNLLSTDRPVRPTTSRPTIRISPDAERVLFPEYLTCEDPTRRVRRARGRVAHRRGAPASADRGAGGTEGPRGPRRRLARGRLHPPRARSAAAAGASPSLHPRHARGQQLVGGDALRDAASLAATFAGTRTVAGWSHSLTMATCRILLLVTVPGSQLEILRVPRRTPANAVRPELFGCGCAGARTPDVLVGRRPVRRSGPRSAALAALGRRGLRVHLGSRVRTFARVSLLRLAIAHRAAHVWRAGRARWDVWLGQPSPRCA